MRRALLKLALVAAIAVFLVANWVAMETKVVRGYQAPVDQVYASALQAIETQGHVVQNKSAYPFSPPPDPYFLYRVDFRIPMKPFGGYGAHMHISGRSDHASVSVIPAAFPSNFPFAFGGGREEIRKIFARMDADLCASDKSRCPSKPPQ